MKDKFVTARLGRPHGLDGSVRIFTENTEENLLKEGRLLLVNKGHERLVEIDGIVRAGEKMFVSFKGIDNPEDARSFLTGSEVWISRENARPLEADAVYCADLIGLDVFFSSEKVGFVKSWIEGAQCILLEVETLDGRNRFVPYMKTFVSAPDFQRNGIELYRDDVLK